MKIFPILLASLLLMSKTGLSAGNIKGDQQLSVWPDVQFIQNFSIRFLSADTSAKLIKVFSDRNGYIQILSSKGLLRLRNGRFLYPGTLVRDNQDRQTSDKNISGLGLYHNQFVYLDNRAVLSNAWAGKLYAHHGLGHASLLAGGRNFSFLISDGQNLTLIRDSVRVWSGRLDRDKVLDIKFDESENVFWILGQESIYKMDTVQLRPEKRYSGSGMTCFELVPGNIVIGTGNGYFVLDRSSGKPVGQVISRMPCPDITSVNLIGSSLWFGSSRGAMKLREDGKFDYYASERWLPSDKVVSIAAGPENSVLVLTDKGLGKICFTEMTLYDKAIFFEKQVRERHIRTGFNATVSGIVNGDVTTGSMEDSDNDGLWTSMYLAAETFRYAVTRSSEALQNIRESLDAMDRLYSINPVPGFPARSFLRRGYKYDDKPWRRADDPEWDWKSTTSSDEVIGHIFAFGAIAELVDNNEIRNQAVALIDTLMSHILKSDFYLIDWDGEPTLWGKWNPDYVNSLHDSSGDRKLNSSNIIAMLQTAYHFTGKEKYSDAALTLMKDHHYLENLRIPMKVIGRAPAGASDWNKMLSGGWNHSDDEMYYVGYWGLYRYALNDTLKTYYRDAIIDHWKAERPEKEGLWNIMTAIADTRVIDLNDAVWYLQKFPLDLIDWSVSNSHRKDIDLITPDFREQTTEEVLPPDELRVSRHNANRFDLDSNGGGREEMSAGDIWLLPYWIGRYLGVISGPVSSAGNDSSIGKQNLQDTDK